MPRYNVKAQGFMHGQLYSPGHPRHGVVYTDEPIEKLPSWLEAMPGESPAVKAKRTKAANKAKKLADEEQKQAKVDIDAVTFTEPSPGATPAATPAASAVTTL